MSQHACEKEYLAAAVDYRRFYALMLDFKDCQSLVALPQCADDLACRAGRASESGSVVELPEARR